MKFRNTLMVAGLCMAGPVLGQTPASQLPQAPVAHRHATEARKPAQAADERAATSTSKIDPEKEAAIRHLMDITNTSKLGDSMAAYISNQVRTVMSRSMDAATLPKFMDTFNEKFAASAPPQHITDAMVPIYDRAFSKEEIQALLKFYESPLGQHVVKVLPAVVQQSQNTAAKIDREAALNVLREMSGEYPQLKKVLPDRNQQAPKGNAPPAAPASPTQP